MRILTGTTAETVWISHTLLPDRLETKASFLAL